MGRFDIEFRDLSYEVNLGFRKGKKKILRKVNGTFPCNKLVGVIGPSGCGKSSLLNILSGYASEGLTGKILINGEDGHLELFQKSCCYVTQEIYLQNLLTVEEQMDITADLKLGSEFSGIIKKRIINDLLDGFGIEQVRQSRICKLSGGERKRLAIALELIDNPTVMFLDEPTTGLDSSSCHQFMGYLKTLSTQGKTIVCSIHQVTASEFHLFDMVYVMAEGGCLYNGRPDDLIPFLEESGMPCPLFHNPADYIIELANGDYGSTKADQLLKISAQLQRDEGDFIDEKLHDTSPMRFDKIKAEITPCFQFKTLMRREFIKAKRNPALTYLRLITSVTNSLVLCTIFWKVGSDGSKVWFNYNAILGFVLHLMMPSMMLTILTFPNEVQILKREHFNRWYSLKAFYASITVIDLPISITYCFVSNAIVYTLMEEPLEWWRFLMFSSLGFLICILAQSIGLLVGVVMDVTTGTFVGSLISLPMMLFGGFFITFRDIPSIFSWLTHFSYLRYGVEGMAGAVNGYNRTDLDCPNDRMCLYRSTSHFMDEMGIDGERFWIDIVALTTIFVVLRVITYYAMKRKVKAVK